MQHHKHPVSWLAASTLVALVALAGNSHAAGTESITWNDAVGDFGPVGDVSFAQLSFDAAGNWTAHWHADAAHPFTGNARFNLNLFDTALGNLAAAHAPQVSLVGFHNFGTLMATDFSYSGQTAYLANWHVGDTVSTGNGTNFLSGVVNMDTPFGRDNLQTQALIVGSVPEPDSWALMLLGLGIIGAIARRRAQH